MRYTDCPHKWKTIFPEAIYWCQHCGTLRIRHVGKKDRYYKPKSKQ